MSSRPNRSQARRSSSSSSSAAAAAAAAAAEARPSSSVILLSPTNQVLLLHRVQTSTSFPSAHVFPGGNLSPFHEGALPLPPAGSPDRHRDSPAYRLAAIRETFEESGILLARRRRRRRLPSSSPDDNGNGSGNDDSGHDGFPLLAVPEADRDRARRDVHGDRLHFADWVRRDLGGAPCADELVPFTRWVTPPNLPRRFTTQMYLFLMPLAPAGAVTGQDGVGHGQAVVQQQQQQQVPTPDGGVEHTAATFADAGEWLRRQARGEIVLFPPQCYLLTLVAEALGSVPGVREADGNGSDSGDGERARLVAQREALLSFVGSAPASAGAVGPAGNAGGRPHPTALIPWSEKVMSPHTLFIRDGDRRIVLGLDKPEIGRAHV